MHQYANEIISIHIYYDKGQGICFVLIPGSSIYRKNRGCYGNGNIVYVGNEFIHENRNSVDPGEQFSIHANFRGGVHGGPHWPPTYVLSIFSGSS